MVRTQLHHVAPTRTLPADLPRAASELEHVAIRSRTDWTVISHFDSLAFSPSMGASTSGQRRATRKSLTDRAGGESLHRAYARCFGLDAWRGATPSRLELSLRS